MDIHEIVKKLIGDILPIGETVGDDKRFENLKTMTELVNVLLTDIDNVNYLNKDSHEFSVKRAAEFASAFFDKIGIVE